MQQTYVMLTQVDCNRQTGEQTTLIQNSEQKLTISTTDFRRCYIQGNLTYHFNGSPKNQFQAIISALTGLTELQKQLQKQQQGENNQSNITNSYNTTIVTHYQNLKNKMIFNKRIIIFDKQRSPQNQQSIPSAITWQQET